MAKVTPIKCNTVVDSKHKEEKPMWPRALLSVQFSLCILKMTPHKCGYQNWLSYLSPRESGHFPEHSAVLKDSARLLRGFICYVFTSFPSKLNPNCYSTLRIHHMESLKIQPIPHYLTFLNEECVFFSFLYFHNSKGD